ncbi:CoA pyrophosphatase [Mycolicibacterium sp.]|uniref:NUDIX hydrolase n=1 Tax=Mycolicibacterium sp. TaxID=2320850 RepID=UPI001E0853D8|nr:CoA pyrophosphatase [Mycolicibacterium sp.]MCB1291220.1 CoA pyrophosphatase [Mycobacterium sp.]MCB9408891.1 CoA pyrophosphatase [Mycolicibacterium sp.]
MTPDGNSRASASESLRPQVRPPWLASLVDNVQRVPHAYRRRVPREMLTALEGARSQAEAARAGRDAAVLVLFSGPDVDHPVGLVPEAADLLLTVRAGSLRHHAGQAAFPGGAADPGDLGPVDTALREAREETGIDPTRLHPLATLERMFIPPSGFHVVPVLAYSPDPGPVAVVDESETAVVARVPLRAFVNPENRLMVCRSGAERRYAGPAFLLNEMLVWGFTGHVISAMLDVAGWAQEWDTEDVRELDEAMALVGKNSEEPL